MSIGSAIFIDANTLASLQKELNSQDKHGDRRDFQPKATDLFRRYGISKISFSFRRSPIADLPPSAAVILPLRTARAALQEIVPQRVSEPGIFPHDLHSRLHFRRERPKGKSALAAGADKAVKGQRQSHPFFDHQRSVEDQVVGRGYMKLADFFFSQREISDSIMP